MEGRAGRRWLREKRARPAADARGESISGRRDPRAESRAAGGHHSPGLISGFSGGEKKSQNKNFDDHITTI